MDYEKSELREAVIVRVEPGRVRVRMGTGDGEAEDGDCRACPMRGMCHKRGGDCIETTIRASELEAAGLKVGDMVRVAYRPAKAWAAIALFLPALVGLFAGGHVAGSLWPNNDAAYLAGCAAGLACGIGVTFLLARFCHIGGRAFLAPLGAGRREDGGDSA